MRFAGERDQDSQIKLAKPQTSTENLDACYQSSFDYVTVDRFYTFRVDIALVLPAVLDGQWSPHHLLTQSGPAARPA